MEMHANWECAFIKTLLLFCEKLVEAQLTLSLLAKESFLTLVWWRGVAERFLFHVKRKCAVAQKGKKTLMC